MWVTGKYSMAQTQDCMQSGRHFKSCTTDVCNLEMSLISNKLKMAQAGQKFPAKGINERKRKLDNELGQPAILPRSRSRWPRTRCRSSPSDERSERSSEACTRPRQLNGTLDQGAQVTD